MKIKNKPSLADYKKHNPNKAKKIKKAVTLGLKQYGETFKKLASN